MGLGLWGKARACALVWGLWGLAACGDDEAQDGGAQDAAQDAQEDDAQGDVGGEDAPADAPGDVPDEVLEPEAQAALFLERYCGGLAEGLCARVEACGCPPVEGWAQTREACEEALLGKCEGGISELLGGIRAGLAQVDFEQLEACVSESLADAEGCTDSLSQFASNACRRTLTTTQGLGEACQEPICADGAGYCAEGGGGGRCEPLPKLGEPCLFVCEEGACLPPAGSPQGQTVCRAPTQAGGACQFGPECARGLGCVEGTCQQPRAEGGACVGQEDCALGLRCEGGACLAQPEACDDPQGCGQGSTCVGTATRECVPVGFAGAGCEYTEQCQEGLYCNVEAQRCEPAAGEGEVCSEGASCGVGLSCDLESGRCGPLPGDGEACGLGRRGPFECAEGLGCVLGVCGALPGEGGTCTLDNQCAEGLGCDFTAEGSVCAPKRGAGEGCMADWICQDGNYCDYGTLLCAPFEALGAACSDGNECGPGRVCGPDAGGEFVCLEAPQEGDVCFLECGPGLTCETVEVEAWCAPSICGLLAP